MRKQKITSFIMEGLSGEIDSILFTTADSVRKTCVGDIVYLRGLIEISNICNRKCAYCGISAVSKANIQRYIMSQEEILECINEVYRQGYGTVVLQSGENPNISKEFISEIIIESKTRYPNLIVTLSLGEREKNELEHWKMIGADRYLLKFETSDIRLYRRIHPGDPMKRIELLKYMKQIGYEIGSGIMIGIPGQSYASIEKDISIFIELELDMIGIGVYIQHDETPLANRKSFPYHKSDQISNELGNVYRGIAITRILCPFANIPATTSISTIDKEKGRVSALQCGANVIMPNITPLKYKKNYEIYPKENGNLNEENIELTLYSINRIREDIRNANV